VIEKENQAGANGEFYEQMSQVANTGAFLPAFLDSPHFLLLSLSIPLLLLPLLSTLSCFVCFPPITQVMNSSTTSLRNSWATQATLSNYAIAQQGLPPKIAALLHGWQHQGVCFTG
jgi:predicted DNA repair protein MutK